MSNFIFAVVLGNMLNYDKRYFVMVFSKPIPI